MPGQPATDEAPAAEQRPEPQASDTPLTANGTTPHEPAIYAAGESPNSHPDPLSPAPIIASGEKAKARDILAAIRTLKTIEQE